MSDSGRTRLESQLLILLDSNSRSLTARVIVANNAEPELTLNRTMVPRRGPSLRVAVVWAAVLLVVVLGVTITATVYPSASTGGGTHSHSGIEPTTTNVGSAPRNPAYRAAVQGFEQQDVTQPGVTAPTFNPKAVALRATTPGPQGSGISMVTVWTYLPNGQNPPWAWEAVVTENSGYSRWDGGGGSDMGPYDLATTHTEDQWPASPAYWVNYGELPSGVARVALDIPGHGTLEVAVTNSWFVAVTSYQFPTSFPVTYFDSAGRVVGRAEYMIRGEGSDSPS